MKKIAFTGLQPTGLVHLGNYLGAILPAVRLQDQHETFICIVDLHAITVDYDPKTLSKNCYHMAAALIASGIDPKKTTLFVQSQVPQHTELAWLLNTITPLGALQRMTQFKEKKDRVEVLSAGLLNYPVLQAADIALYKGEIVPVGEDQVQHLELSREILRRFNTLFGKTFPEPETLVSKETARVMALNDPTKKMSKSVEGSFIALTDSDAEIAKKIKRAVTDVGPQDPEKMSPGVANLFMLLKNFSAPKVYQTFIADYENKTLKYAPLKDQLADELIRHLSPLREKIFALEKDSKSLNKILTDGADKARSVATATIKEVTRKMGLIGLA